MKIARIYISAVLLAVTLVATSCSESGTPVAPDVAQQQPYTDAELLGLLSPTLQRLGLMTCKPLPRATAVATIGKNGGTMQIGPHKFEVPKNALKHNVTIRAVAPSGRYRHVEFQPHGLEFKKSAKLTLSYKNCDLLGSLLPKHIAHTTDNLRILYLLQSVDDVLNQKVTGRIDHFSDYVLAW
jgi:hypothetical protein